MGQHLAFPDAGVSADIDLTTGRYEVRQDQFAWKFAGQLDSELRNPGHAYNEDTLGLYDEYSFDYGGGTRRASIRFYYRRPIVLFTDEYLIRRRIVAGSRVSASIPGWLTTWPTPAFLPVLRSPNFPRTVPGSFSTI